ncbi:MAG: hypothetical protein QNK35_12470, partial [Bacteroides sp.]|nr:hypothetical protein [Bacteroides sp.]
QLPELLGEIEEPLRDVLIISPNSPSHLLVRMGNWVFIPDQDEGGFQGKKIGDHLLAGAAAFALTGQVNSDFVEEKIKADAPPEQLYNLEKDPAQSVNVFGQHPEVEQEMKQILEEYRSKTGAEPRLGWINIEAVRKQQSKK